MLVKKQWGLDKDLFREKMKRDDRFCILNSSA